MEKIKQFVQSKAFKWVMGGIGAVIALLIVFKAGELVGFRKAGFSYRWGENYYRGMTGPHEGKMPRGFESRDFMMGHGTFGSVISVSSSSLVIKGGDGAERVVLFTPKTEIRRFRDTIAPSGLAAGENVTVVGAPNDAGQIEAKLIRVMPPLPDVSTSTQETF
ncbi:MAG: hypothetical protein V1656_00680 [Candidatus Jorgensenbacteria bacterium]